MTSHEEMQAGNAPDMSTGCDGAKAPHKLPIRTLVAASVGNAVEWYDWAIYATFSIYFATQIFSAENEALAFILTFITYALAFFFRPLGGFLLGRYADLKGRKQAMLLTIVLMAGGSLVIAILPTYAAVGWLAPILLLLARIAQGMSLGGEVSSASAYLAEIAPPDRRGRYSSCFYVSTGTAVLLASLLGAFLASTLTDDQLASWGWRIPFLIGAALGLVGLWMRRDMAETKQFEANVANAKAIKNPLRLTLRAYPKSVAQLIGLTLLSTLCYYTFLGVDPVRGQGQRARRRNGVLGAFDRHRAICGAAIPLRLDRRSVRPQASAAPVVGRNRAADCAGLDADPTRGRLRFGAAGVLLRTRPLRDEELDRPGDHERAIPDQTPRPGHRCLVQPYRRRLRRHRSAGHPVAQQHRPQQLVLLVCGGRRSRGVLRHADPPRDQGGGAQVRQAT